MNNVLPVSLIISVTIAGIPQGLTERNVNVVALFTTETPGNLDPYRSYTTPTSVATDYGSSSVTYEMASNIFAQSPNLLSGRGKLVIVPMQSAVSATQGDYVTAALTANLAALIVVADGDIRFTLNGNNIDLTGLDFTGASTIEDIAEIFQNNVDMVNIDVEYTATDKITFTSKKVGDDSDVDMVQLPAGAGTDLSAAGLLNSAGGSATSGANASGETLVAAITRIESSVFFAGVITNLEMEDAVISTTASSVQSSDRIFLHHFADTNDIAGIASTVQAATQTKTRCLGYFQTPAEANLMKAGYVGRAFSTNFSGSNTSTTLNLKTIANVTPDGNVNETLYAAAKVAGMDLYVSYDGVSSILSTGGNLYFDQIYSRTQLKFALEAAGFNYLRQTNTKVPQTESGMDGLKGAYSKVLKRFVTVGYIGAGLEWNSSETFGDPEDFRRNITDKGYYVYSIPISQQSSSDRALRVAPLCQMACKEAGAIHTSDVIVVVEA